MPQFYKIAQTVVHITTVRADSLEDAQEHAAGMGDDDFAWQVWGDTEVKQVPNDSICDEDIRMDTTVDS